MTPTPETQMGERTHTAEGVGGKHTPGTWDLIAPDEHHGWYVEDGLGRSICDLYYLNGHTVIDHDPGGHGETEANARLIAAAPDLLAALKAVKHGAEYEDELGDVIEAALSKAEASDVRQG
jgi:hypothetical protein